MKGSKQMEEQVEIMIRSLNRRAMRGLVSLVVAAVLLLAGGGCGQNDAIRLRHDAEKKLFDAERSLTQATVNPNAVSPEQMEAATEEFAAATEFVLTALASVNRTMHPVEHRELQQLAFQTASRLNRLLYMQRRYDESVGMLSRLVGEADLAPEELMVARINLGRSLQASGNWDSALVVYETTLETYYPPVSSTGELVGPLFNLPAHIFEVVRRVGDSVSARYQFERAVTYYNELAEGYPTQQVGISSRMTLSDLYEVTGQWQKQITELEKLADPSSEAHAIIQARIAEIYGLKLRQFARGITMYDSLLTAVGPSDTMLYPDLLFKKALVRMEQKRFADARGVLTELKRDHRRYFAQTAQAQLALARTFELENNWDRAEVEYNALVEMYRGSEEAMAAFLYVARRYEQVGRKDQAQRWYEDAGEYYTEIARLGAGGLLTARASDYRAELLARQGKVREAAETLVGIYRTFPNNETGWQALMRAAALYRDRLGEPAVADSLVAVLRSGLTHLGPAAEL